MVFSSIEFIWLFMPVVLALYLVFGPSRRNALLALMSLAFYAFGAQSLLLLFVASILLNYIAGRIIGRARDAGDERTARLALWAGIVVNLALLFSWKYAVFAVTQLNKALDLTGTGELGVPSIALPIGISFFTFHGISYIVDISRGTAKPMRRVADYAQYMAFFPQLIAGPIVRYHQIEAQIRTPPPRAQRLDDIAEGFPRFAWGLCKKVLIADQVGLIADAAFAPGAPSGATAWVGALAYTVQIYFDFSGYSDMAIGLARMFGFRFPENFARPYSSVSMTDFWRRWHMTLSGWFRDYVYIPLGGSRGATETTVRNLMVVFFLTGAWHGAAWTFVLWGLYNGVLLVGERLTGISVLPDERLAIVRRAATLLLVIFGWVLFRSNGTGQALDFYRAMASLHPGSLSPAVEAAATTKAQLALAVGVASVLLPRDFVVGRILQSRWSGAPLAARMGVIAVLPLAAIAVAAGSFSPFLYFRF
jgi:alginate O-acetyltransferase complex protein AlgI